MHILLVYLKKSIFTGMAAPVHNYEWKLLLDTDDCFG